MKRLFRMASLFLVVALLAACGGQSQKAQTAPAPAGSAAKETPAAPVKTETVTVGYAKSAAFSNLFVALEKGYFKDEGIEVQTKEFPGTSDAVSAISTGAVDTYFGSIAAGIFNAINKGLDFKITAPLGIQPEKTTIIPLLVRKDLWESGAVKSGKDLKGKKVAINAPGGSVEYKLALILQKYGLSLSDVQVTPISFPNMVTALQSKSIDAAIPAEPYAARAIKQGLVEVVPGDSDLAGGDMTTMLFYSGKFSRERADVGVRFMKALIRGARDLQGDKWKSPENVAAIKKYTGMPESDILEAVFPIFDPDLAVGKYVDSLDKQQMVHMANKRLDYTAKYDIKKTMDGSFSEKAVAALKK